VYEFSAVAQDYSAVPGATSAVFAHEMGHNLGFRHDEDITPCICDDPVGKCIMSAVARLVYFADSLPYAASVSAC